MRTLCMASTFVANLSRLSVFYARNFADEVNVKSQDIPAIR
jgi:hypothetical protein